MRRALVLATRLAGTDGVSLESRKMEGVLGRLGFETVACAGEVDEVAGRRSITLPEMHFRDPRAVELGERAFGHGQEGAGGTAGSSPDPTADPVSDPDLEAAAQALFAQLRAVAADVRPDLLVVQNAWAIPMQLPLARALALLVDATALPTISHEHDYWWERERFAAPRARTFLDTYFPYDGPTVTHLCINSRARHELETRRGLHARLLPNVMDFDTPAPGLDGFNSDFRHAIGLSDDARMFLQPTRVVPRKGIELAIDLLAALEDPRNVLVITHAAGDEGLDYLRGLERYAADRSVDLRHVADQVGDERGTDPRGRKRYALGDAYPHADFVTYPSLYEGFGNALLETVYYRRPALVNRYHVYRDDIAPMGFRFVEIDGAVTPAAVREVAELLASPGRVAAMTAHNLEVARQHVGLGAMERVVRDALGDVGLGPS